MENWTQKYWISKEIQGSLVTKTCHSAKQQQDEWNRFWREVEEKNAITHWSSYVISIIIRSRNLSLFLLTTNTK